MPHMDGMRVRRTVRAMLLAGEISGRSPVSALPYVGPFFAARLRRKRLTTVGRLVRHFHRAGSAAALDLMTRLLQNPRANRCQRSAPWRERYHVADVNHGAFASVRHLLLTARWMQRTGRSLPGLPSPVALSNFSPATPVWRGNGSLPYCFQAINF